MTLRAKTAVAAMALLGVLILPVGAAAGSVVVVNERFEDFVQIRDNNCIGEEVTFTGILHRVELLQPDGTSRVLISVQATGTGTLGNFYTIRDLHHLITLPDGTFSEVFRDRLITQGPAPDQHVLITVEGPPFTVTFETDCTG